MALTPQDVVRKEFREAFRGYNQADVDLFLDEIVEELNRLVEENQRMKVRVTALQQELARYRPGEPVPPAETSEARWRLRRFLEEQGRPLDEIEPVRSPTVERIAREVPQGPDDPPGATGARPVVPPAAGGARPAAPPPAPDAGARRPGSDEPPPEGREPVRRPPARPSGRAGQPEDAAVERPWERESKPFWASE